MMIFHSACIESSVPIESDITELLNVRFAAVFYSVIRSGTDLMSLLILFLFFLLFKKPSLQIGSG